MSTLAEKLQKWSLQELNLTSEGQLNEIPDVESFCIITKGKYKRVWNYVINHVRSRATVDKVKRTLYLKKLKETEESILTFYGESSDDIKLNAAISKATEKRAYLMRSLSTVQERVVNLEKKIKCMRDETFEINQKAALLELVIQLYAEKNSNLRDLLKQISACKNSLNAYQSPKIHDKAVMALPRDFLFENKVVYDENSSRVKDLISMCSAILEKKFVQNEDDDLLVESFQLNHYVLKKKNVLLTDLVILLKEISCSDLQQFIYMNAHSLSMTDLPKSKNLLTQMECDNVHNSISSLKNRKKIDNLSHKKKEVYELKIKNMKSEPDDLVFEVKCALFEKLAENNALIISNSHLEDYLEYMSNKTSLVLEKLRQQKQSKELNSELQAFYKKADFVFYLLYTFLESTQKTIDDVNKLQLFAHTELFESRFPKKEWVEEFKGWFDSDRKLTWEYLNKNNFFPSLVSDFHITDLSLTEVQKSLNFQSFQNVSSLFKYWVEFKQKLLVEVFFQSDVFIQNTDINVPELYTKIIKMLENMKVSGEKAELMISDGKICYDRNKFLLQEWWEQNAQYIPNIEYEGKTLKMWIDILSALSDFEPPNYI